MDSYENDYQMIKKVEEKILLVISHYLEGNVIASYNSFNYLMKKIDPVLDSFKLLERDKELMPYKELYRIRLSDLPSLEMGDLFHVPYNKRRIINSYRFSIPGNPALYLGTSSYICWEEMDRPSFDEIHISKFELAEDNTVNLLNISVTNKILLSYLNKFPEEEFDERITIKTLIKTINSYLILWPIIASCQIKVKERQMPFKPEYIIPQILMQHVQRNSNIDGIIFSSTRVNVNNIDPNKTINVVFPAKKQIDSEKFCSTLVKKIYMTSPLSCKLYRTVIHKGLLEYEQKNDLELVKGLQTIYSDSDFGFYEKALKKLTVSPVLNG